MYNGLTWPDIGCRRYLITSYYITEERIIYGLLYGLRSSSSKATVVTVVVIKDTIKDNIYIYSVPQNFFFIVKLALGVVYLVL